MLADILMTLLQKRGGTTILTSEVSVVTGLSLRSSINSGSGIPGTTVSSSLSIVGTTLNPKVTVVKG